MGRKGALWLVAWVLIGLSVDVSAEVNLPELGDSASTELSAAQAKSIGRSFIQQVRQRQQMVEDQELTDYLQSLGDRLVSYSDAEDRDFHFFVIDQPTVNAFAVPGGVVGFHSGLWLLAETEHELAGVMAHEIVHVTQNHIARALEASSSSQAPVVAAVLAAIFLGGEMDPELMEAAIVTSAVAGMQQQVNFTRQNEQEADRLGVDMLARAGFNPIGMSDFFKRMQRSSGSLGGQVFEFLQTHPLNLARITDAEDRIRGMEVGEYRTSGEFLLMREKLRVYLSTTPRKLIADYRHQIRRAKGAPPHARYGLALALTADRQFSEARTILRSLVKGEHSQAAYLQALAALEAQAGKPAEARVWLQRLLEAYPDRRAARLYLAELALRGGDLALAKRELLRLEREERLPLIGYKLLAETFSRSGAPHDGHYYLASYHYLNGNPRLAVDQLRVGIDLEGGSFYQRSRMEALLEAWTGKKPEKDGNAKGPSPRP